jgi:hypothetical protein
MPADRADGWLAWLFALYALPLAIAMALITPPFQNPDEDGHFLRAVQIAGGEFAGRHLPGGGAGGRVDPAARLAGLAFKPLAGHPERRLDRAVTEDANRLRWGAPPEDASFPNTVLWSPVLYFPAAAAVLVGRAADLSVLTTLRLCRLVNVVIAVALGFAALRLWPSGRALLFSLLAMPMALSLFGSAAHDGLMITGAALAVALILRRHAASVLGGALLLGLIAAGRPVYAPLVLLPLLDRWTAPRAWIGVALGAACIASWAPIAEAARVEFPHDGLHVDSSEQLAYLLGHLQAIPTIALHTLIVHGREYVIMVIGAIGALDTLLPKPYYVAAALTLAVACCADALGPSARRGAALVLAVLLASAAAVFLSQDLIWTAVGADVIEGVQGRYFLPLAPLAALLIAGLAGGCAPRGRTGALIWIALFPLVTAVVTPLTLVARYYG